jgi:hypothetical protein
MLRLPMASDLLRVRHQSESPSLRRREWLHSHHNSGQIQLGTWTACFPTLYKLWSIACFFSSPIYHLLLAINAVEGTV